MNKMLGPHATPSKYLIKVSYYCFLNTLKYSAVGKQIHNSNKEKQKDLVLGQGNMECHQQASL